MTGPFGGPGHRFLAIGAIAVGAAVVGGWALGGRTIDALLVAALAFGGAGVVAWLTAVRPVAAFGVLFLLSSVTRLTLELPVGAMRVEQPAIAAALLVLAFTGGFRGLRGMPRSLLYAALGFGVYLAVLAIASAIFPPDPIASLHLVAWQAISLAGGLAALLLLRRAFEGAVPAIALTGALHAAIGIGLAILFLALGPGMSVGIQGGDSALPKVRAVAWEANLYASFLVGTLPFAMEIGRARPRLIALLPAALLLLGIPLGVTRGAELALAAAIPVFVGVVLYRERGWPRLVPVTVTTLAAIVLGWSAAGFLLPNALERLPAPITGEVAPTAGSGTVTAASPAEGPSPMPSLRPYPDTLAFRLRRVPLAFDDLRTSPIIGLGMESFGQRHPDPSQGGAPDHIAILAVAALYESGIVGAAALLIAFALILVGLWSASREPGRAGPAAAFMASIVALLVAYQATNALHFGSNWLIVGAAAACIAAGRGDGRRPRDVIPKAG
jgi:hypothetical protein